MRDDREQSDRDRALQRLLDRLQVGPLPTPDETEDADEWDAELLARYVTGIATPVEREIAEAIMADSPRLRAEAEALRQTVTTLRAPDGFAAASRVAASYDALSQKSAAPLIPATEGGTPLRSDSWWASLVLPRWRFISSPITLSAVAVCAVLLFVFFLSRNSAKNRRDDVALRPSPTLSVPVQVVTPTPLRARPTLSPPSPAPRPDDNPTPTPAPVISPPRLPSATHPTPPPAPPPKPPVLTEAEKWIQQLRDGSLYIAALPAGVTRGAGGEDGPTEIAALAPVNVITRSRPTLRWQGASPPYTLRVWDAGASLSVDPRLETPVDGNEFSLPDTFPGGQGYRWQVSATADGVEQSSSSTLFKVINDTDAADLERLEKATRNDAMAHAIVLAHFGLLDEAERLATEAAERNPKVAGLAKKLKERIVASGKSANGPVKQQE